MRLSWFVCSAALGCSPVSTPSDAGSGAGGGTVGGGSVGGGSVGGGSVGGGSVGGGSVGGGSVGGGSVGGGLGGGGFVGGGSVGGGASDGGFGYPLPGPGQALALGTSTAASVRPSFFTASEWQYSLFDSFGGGVFVPWYSRAGAYVIAGTGGHNHPDFTGAVAFDFETGRWDSLADATGTPMRSSPILVSETNGSPEYEIALPGTPADTVPAPPHPYMNLIALSPTHGGGPRGSVVYPIATAQCRESVVSTRPHRFDLSTRRWSRWGAGRLMSGLSVSFESPSVFDATANRIWQLPDQIHSPSRISFLDVTQPSPAWQLSPSWQFPPTWEATSTAWVDETRRLLLMQTPMRLIALDLNDLAAGPRQLQLQGTLPGELNRWHLNPADGAFYTKPSSGNVLFKLVPPATTPFTSMWTVSTVTITGATLPAANTGVRHYTRFFYVPALGCFAWIANATTPPFLISPP